MNGKGDTYRKQNKDELNKFEQNFERIFGSKSKANYPPLNKDDEKEEPPKLEY